MSPIEISANTIELNGLKIGFSGRVVLECPQLVLNSGEILGLLGASGTGKTTMFATVAGNIEPIGGDIRRADQILTREWRRRNIARTLQNHPLLHWLTVEQNVLLAARLREIRGVDPRKILDEVAAAHLADRYPANLSGGERCRVSLAMGLVSQPQILLLDEPFNGLDAVVKREAARAVKDFTRRHRCAAILTTHDIEDALECSRKVAVIRKGVPSRISELWDVPDTPRERVDLAERILAHLA